MKKKKILFISHDSSLYGAQRSLLDLVLNLDCNLFSPTVLVRTHGPLSEELLKNGIRVRQLPFAWWVSQSRKGWFVRFGKNLLAALQIRREGWISEIDLIYTNTSVVPIGGLLAWLFKRPHVWHIREFATEHYGFRFDFGFLLSAHFVNKVSKAVVFNSNAVRNKYSEYIPPEKTRTIYNGVINLSRLDNDFEGKTFDQSNKLKICIVGNISQAKGQVRAAKALKIILETGLDACLYVVGSGPSAEVAKLRSLVMNLGIGDNVIFEGYSDEVERFFQDADVCWVCSQAEAFGRVIVESMAAGTPVIAGDCGGVPEIIADGVTGVLYPERDVNALAQKTIELINDSEKYREMSRRAYAVAMERFNCSRYVAEIEEVMISALGEA